MLVHLLVTGTKIPPRELNTGDKELFDQLFSVVETADPALSRRIPPKSGIHVVGADASPRPYQQIITVTDDGVASWAGGDLPVAVVSAAMQFARTGITSASWDFSPHRISERLLVFGPGGNTWGREYNPTTLASFTALTEWVDEAETPHKGEQRMNVGFRIEGGVWAIKRIDPVGSHVIVASGESESTGYWCQTRDVAEISYDWHTLTSEEIDYLEAKRLEARLDRYYQEAKEQIARLLPLFDTSAARIEASIEAKRAAAVAKIE